MSTIKVKNIQHPSAADPAIVLNPDGSVNVDIGELSASSLNGGGFGFRNKLINGSFDIWQRGTTFSGSVYTADRWKISSVGGAANRVFGPDGVTTYGIQIAEGTAGIMQFIELPATGRAGEYQVGTTWTLSWYQSNTDVVQIRNIMFRDSADTSGDTTAQQFGTPVAVETVGSWTRYKAEITITESPVSSSTCMRVSIGNNGVTNTQYSGIQFEKGGLTAFEQRFKGFELDLCQRYYEVLRAGGGGSWGNGTYGAVASYKQQKRRVPEITIDQYYYRYPNVAFFVDDVTDLGFAIQSTVSGAHIFYDGLFTVEGEF